MSARVGSEETSLRLPISPSSSRVHTCGFAVSIILGIGGMATGIVGLGGYFRIGALANITQINALVMIASGGGGIILSIAGIVCAVKKRASDHCEVF